jgi:Putative zinc binding domain/C-methyltransferase C-terminal domain
MLSVATGKHFMGGQENSISKQGNTFAWGCRLRHSPLTKTFADLGMSPLCESFLAADHIDQMEPYFPLRTLVCSEYFLVQPREYVKPEFIFTEYAYFSSYSTSWIEHARQYCEMIVARFGLGSKSEVLEIASNDGCTPGMHIPIHPVSAIDELRPDYLLILPWNLKSEIVGQMRHVGAWACKIVIIPIPDVEVIDPRDLSS